MLSYHMSFLLRKEHTLLQAVLRKGKNKLSTLGGSSWQHKPKFHFVLQEKWQPNLPLSFLLLLKAMGFVSVQVYARMMIWTSCCNEENCVLGSIFCRHQFAAPFSARAPFHFYLTKKEIALTVFRTISNLKVIQRWQGDEIFFSSFLTGQVDCKVIKTNSLFMCHQQWEKSPNWGK